VYVNDVCPQQLLIWQLEPRRWVGLPVPKGHAVEASAIRPLVEPGARPDSPASPEVRRFLDDFGLALPRTIAETERATPETILQHSLDVEDAGKIHFAGWLPLPEQAAKPGHPNLQKIRRAYGQDAFELCLHLHLGARWTEDVTQRVEFHLPE
jgi:hypothetical protein